MSLHTDTRNIAVIVQDARGQWAPLPLRILHPASDNAHRLAVQPLGGAAKRWADIIIAGAISLFLAPVFAAIALAITLESPGPVLFRQWRGGFRGRVFSIFKFRTMAVEEEGDDVKQAVPGDERVTAVGSFLRRTSLDELPQLLNVLAGDMSLVGPRPHAISHDHAFAEIDDRYCRRQIARPGITGLAQVSGARGPTLTAGSVHRRLTLDLLYLDHWSLWLDLQILLRTLAVVARGDDAV